MNKPLLILNCSGAKNEASSKAQDLYLGAMFVMLRSKKITIEEEFELLILSAKHGLIHGSEWIDNYELRAPSRKEIGAQDEFVEKHSKQAIKTLETYKGSNRDIGIFMTKDYMALWDKMFPTENFHGFEKSTISYDHRGIGELKGRLNAFLKIHLSS
ncbi:hypothetical protein A1QO_02575 [Vibrio genomosp. F10 str. ZF-129]|uniref:DUF6884 domain-containing protein n=1 Tax=Vibrio genomosp. F10 str. ZF-129 TaxID=1187848 RepID=A0A1E5BKA3_9VIBR|nr:DUF6884 domain-containing protein [Vibrio genomosp. F10]OEE38282.1 hypothetical protein A1QO_02575 [Vibrio genomosp. F10 str. ZF-129]